jgi:hypothetical protein
MTKISRSFRTTPLLKTAVASIVLTACSGVSISTPAADAVIALPSTAHVEITSSRSISNVKLSVDGTDVSNQVSYSTPSGNYVADLTLAAGFHTIVASADAYCSYCTGQTYRASDTKKFCVGAGGGATNKTLFSQADNLGWSSATSTTTAIAADAGPETKWIMFPKGAGIVSVPGTIQSKMFLCSCLRAPADANGTLVELAPCDNTDSRQVWDGTRQQLTGGTGFYQFHNEGVGIINRGCLAEGNSAGGTAGKLVLGDCSVVSDQLWKVRNNTSNSFESDQSPWGQ